MAVKIIKAEPDPEVVKRVVCRGCGATLEYVPNDVKCREGPFYSGGSTWVDCPNCKQAATISSW